MRDIQLFCVVPHDVITLTPVVHTLESAIHQINHYPAAKGDITRDDSQGRFLAQHSVATLLRYFFEWLQRYSNITTLCFAKNPYTFPIKVVARRC